MQHYSVFSISQFNFIACGCQTPGSTSNTCSNDGKCICNIGYEGDKCSECTSEYYKTQAGCTGIIVMVDLMCLNKLLADFCMIYKILGSVAAVFLEIYWKLQRTVFENTCKWLFLDFMYLRMSWCWYLRFHTVSHFLVFIVTFIFLQSPNRFC